ncbi:hypothetical protein [Spirulina sp. 06S082]|uniref:hypothetical protein n=1 Tax=Spirulina sp. 06S082 TaxID=3110248 RepID=UPI002B21A16D|nr:hypothetical protein [Spirulina sp. 06S082]MEA5470352.1 hypothetical protein [Spirulina sp. 06S082]
MNFSLISQRLKDLEHNIREDMELLNEFEEESRYETNPRIKAGYRKEIKRQQESITKYKKEYTELKKELDNSQESLAEVQNIYRQLEQMDSKLNLLVEGQVTIYQNLNQMQQNLLDQYDMSEQAVIAEIVKQLNNNQLTLTQTL